MSFPFFKYYPYFIFLLVFEVGINCYLIAQPNALSFQALTSDQGLSEPSNAFIYRCSRGFLWTSSLEGLNRFDGKKSTPYNPLIVIGDSTFIDPNITSNTYEDPKGNLWFTVSEGVITYERAKDTLLYHPVIHPTTRQKITRLYAFHLDEENNLWLVGNKQFVLYNINNKQVTVLGKSNAVRAYPIFNREKKIIGIASTIFGGKDAGIQMFEYKAGKLSPAVSFFDKNNTLAQPATRIFHFLVESDTNIWLPTQIGLIHFNPQTRAFQLYSRYNQKDIKNLVDVIAWKENYLWVASSSQGLYLFDKKRQQFIGQDTAIWVNNQMIDFKRINNLYIDKEDNLWCSVWGKGIYFTNLQASKFTHRLPADIYVPPHPHNVTSIAEDTNGTIWCGVPQKGMYHFQQQDNNNINVLMPPVNQEIPLNSRVRSMLCDKNGNVWLISETLELYSKEHANFKKVAGNFRNLRKIIQIADHRWLVLTYNQVLEIYKKERSFIIDTIALPSLSEDVFANVFAAAPGMIYLCYGTDGIVVLSKNDGQWKRMQEIRGIGHINHLIQDEKNPKLLWATSDRGFIKIDKSNWTKAFLKDSAHLLMRSFNGVLQDHNGDFWLSSNAGIFQWKPTTQTVVQYTKSDGLQSMEFLPGSCLKASDGSLWFGSSNGVHTIQPAAIKLFSVQPRIQMTDIQVNGQAFPFDTYVGELDGYTFNHDENTLSFEFVALEFSDAANNLFEFRLKNFEEDWVKAGARGYARYPNLPPGDYILQIKAANSDGVWTEKPKEFKIKILPPWWQTWWAKTFLGLSLLGMVYGIYRDQIARIKRKEAFRRKEAEYRQKEAEYKQLVAETETAVLRLQMNPHFIFNSMNSISSYILQKDVDTANNYLSRFAKLMRMILKFAEKPFITIAEEIDLLEQYLQTEAMRLEKKFTYHFDIAADLDPDDVLLPPMILQPFVENAIWHGLSPKRSEGHIKIRFWTENQALYCSVEDNGIGRMAAVAQKQAAKAHESKALSITKRRLQLLETVNGGTTSLQIIDLYSEAEIGIGTQVVLRLPLL